jgi:hypothetical protein
LLVPAKFPFDNKPFRRKNFLTLGYDVRLAIADTIGITWGKVRFGKDSLIVPEGEHLDAPLLLVPCFTLILSGSDWSDPSSFFF